jgi:peptidoglycan/LPS O-acetylase OafA/YrhL
VLAVLVCHQGLSSGSRYYSGGALGVDVFFVLSGFLITSLLLVDHANTGRVISVGFWARRARRLLPAVFVFVAILIVYAVFVARPGELGPLRDGAIATLLYVRNYWGATDSSPLTGHLWSLSVEEQFYIAWPFLLALLAVLTRRRRWLVVTVLALAGASAAMMAFRYAGTHSIRYVYVATETRAQDLLVGSALGIVLFGRRFRGVALEVAGFFALAFLVLATVKVSDFRPQLYQGGFLAVSFAAAVLIAASVSEGSPRLRALLSWRPLVWIGLISYGLYLYHVPLFAFVDAQYVVTAEPARFVLRFLLVGLVATASYVFIERPIRRGALSRSTLLRLAPITAVVVVGALLASTAGARSEPPVERQSYAFSRVKSNAPGDALRVLVVGDSLASSLVSGLDPYFSGDGTRGVVEWASRCDVIGGTLALTADPPPPPPVCAFEDSYRGAVKSFDPDVSVVVLGPSVVFDRFVDGRRLAVGTPAFEAHLFRRLDAVRSLLVANGASFTVTTVPCMTPPTTGQYGGLAAIQRDEERVAAVNDALRTYADDRDVPIADLGPLVCSHLDYLNEHGNGFSADGRTAVWNLLAATARSTRG